MLQDLRQNYQKHELLETNVSENPFILFDLWFANALENEQIREPNAMQLATVSDTGQPSLRTVLLKNIEPNKGFVFYTNYLSKKGLHIQKNSKVALLFFWDTLERQIRIEGTAHKLTHPYNEQYFKTRPIGSQIGAIVSPQSNTIPNRQVLETKMQVLENEAKKNKEIIECPLHWGGYLVQPHLFEFWQGRPNRLHDRLQYTLLNNNTDPKSWQLQRLAP